MERRIFEVQNLEVRAAEEGGDSPGTIVGYAAVFDKLSVVMWGFFREKIEKGAFADSLSGDVRALWNHNTDFVIGRTRAETLTLEEDDHGLKVEIRPPASAAGFAASIKRGDVTQMSFGFEILDSRWDKDDDEQWVRTLIRVKLYEVSPCTFPAYPDTEVGMRSWQGVEPERPQLLIAESAQVAERSSDTSPRFSPEEREDDEESDQRALVEIEATDEAEATALRAQAEAEADLCRLQLVAAR